MFSQLDVDPLTHTTSVPSDPPIQYDGALDLAITLSIVHGALIGLFINFYLELVQTFESTYCHSQRGSHFCKSLLMKWIWFFATLMLVSGSISLAVLTFVRRYEIVLHGTSAIQPKVEESGSTGDKSYQAVDVSEKGTLGGNSSVKD